MNDEIKIELKGFNYPFAKLNTNYLDEYKYNNLSFNNILHRSFYDLKFCQIKSKSINIKSSKYFDDNFN